MRWTLSIFILFICISASSQQRFNQHNNYLTNSEVLWLKSHKIDFVSAPISDEKLIGSAKNAIKYRNIERNKSALTGVFGVLGIAGMTYGLVSKGNSFNSDGLNAVLGIGGVIATSISVKYYLDKRKNNKLKKQHLEMCSFLLN